MDRIQVGKLLTLLDRIATACETIATNTNPATPDTPDAPADNTQSEGT